MSWLKIILIAIPVLAVSVYFGLPRALNLLGLHPHYEIPEFDLAGKRALKLFGVVHKTGFAIFRFIKDLNRQSSGLGIQPEVLAHNALNERNLGGGHLPIGF